MIDEEMELEPCDSRLCGSDVLIHFSVYEEADIRKACQIVDSILLDYSDESYTNVKSYQVDFVDQWYGTEEAENADVKCVIIPECGRVDAIEVKYYSTDDVEID